MAQNQITRKKNEASIKNLEMQIGQLSRKMEAQASSCGGLLVTI